MARDILLVDDDTTALQNYGNEIRLKLNLEPFLAESAADAINILQSYPIKVLVTDQEMPNMSGTELVAHLRNELKLAIPCIMLTGYSDKVGASDAINLKFANYVDKNDVTLKLADSIRSALHQYDFESALRSAISVNKILSEKSSFLRFNSSVVTTLLQVKSVIDRHIREEDWQTNYTAQRHIAQKHELSIKRRVASSIESTESSEMLAKLGIKIGDIVGGLQPALESKSTLTLKEKYDQEWTIEAKETLEIKEISDSPGTDGKILQSRQYQSAPIFIRIDCTIGVKCNCCNIDIVYQTVLLLPTNQIALRQVEHYNLGSEKKIYTGVLDGTTSWR